MLPPDSCVNLALTRLPLQPITSFVATADAKFGPITTIRKNGKIIKKIPWSAFRLEKEDWDRVKLCVEILEVCF